MQIPFNKRSNLLRRSDEAEPEQARRRPHDELGGVYGGFSAQMARNRRHSKSARKADMRPHGGRHVKGVA
ncbi:MAG: hypothetical protein PHF00_05875 [Elusimicrobia bacterium]|nr:hypothetical protein [Elusimicrobiota bacterium]